MQTITTGAPSLYTLAARYDSDEKCVELLESLRWPDGHPKCPKCDSAKCWDIRGRKVYQCGDCDFQYSVTTGTVMHSTKLPLVKWILAAALLSNARKGVSSCQMARDLNVTQRTAWYLCHRLRRAMRETEWLQKFRGICELDESYLGGVRKGKRGRGAAHKSVVFGVKQRGGRVAMQMVPDAKHESIRKVVLECVDKSATLMADSYPSYNQLAAEFALHRIDHQVAYVQGQIHTQGIESLWAILKRQYHGTHHKISAKYLPLYLGEITYRFNHRMNPKLFSMILGNGLMTDRMVLNQSPNGENPVT